MKNQLLAMYETMVKIRFFEEKAVELVQAGDVCGAAHLCVGQEAVAAGVCATLLPTDYIMSTHRGHGHCIAKGGDLKKMMAELLGRTTGYSKGRGGSMHIADLSLGICGANGIVGAGLSIAVGVGLSALLEKTNRAVVCFFGDGAANQGTFHESLNLAALWKLPIVYVCENNQYAISTSACKLSVGKGIYNRGSAYGIEGFNIDGNDCGVVHEQVAKAVKKAKEGGGPTIIECQTYRVLGHYVGDPCTYRSKEEVNEWKTNKDPLKITEKKLIDSKVATQSEIDAIKEKITKEINEAVDFAKSSPFPEAKDVMEGVYGKSNVDIKVPVSSLPAKGTRELTFRDAINETLRDEMKKDSKLCLVGEDIGIHGGAFQVTKGLYKEFGAERVRETPISENTIVACGLGAAVTGLHPVAEIMYIDFTGLAMDQIVNQAAKFRYMLGGNVDVPLVIRTAGGSGGKANAAQHSQSLEAWFMHVPGLKVVMPSTPYDAKGLLKSALLDKNPVMYIEHKGLYNTKGFVPTEDYSIPFGQADIKRTGKDITIIAVSRSVIMSLAAAEKLAAEGIEAEVVDLRTLVPLDIETIVESVKKTHNVLVATEDCKTGGIAAEIMAQITENCFDYLDSPAARVAGLDVPIPYTPSLEKVSIPGEDDIVKAVKKILG